MARQFTSGNASFNAASNAAWEARCRANREAEQEFEHACTRATFTREECFAEFEAAREAWTANPSDENGQRFATAAQRKRAWN